MLDHDQVEREIVARDSQVANKYSKDLQLMAIPTPAATAATAWRGSSARTACSTPRHGPLIAVRLNILTRKTLGGIETEPRRTA